MVFAEQGEQEAFFRALAPLPQLISHKQIYLEVDLLF